MPERHPSIGAIVVNWNGGTLAAECAAALRRQTSPVRLWIVDHASTDGSLDAMLAAFPEATPERSTENRGFAAGNNAVLATAWQLDYLLLINNDAIIPEPDALERMVEFMERDDSVHGVCGRYEYPDGDFQPFYNRLPSFGNLLVHWGPGKYIPALRHGAAERRYLMADFDFGREGVIEQPAFSCVLMRASSARRVGLLDERFPIFFNDVDYCWRWRELGWSWHYRPDWRIVHHQSRSTGRLGEAKHAEMASSVVRFARKHHGHVAAMVVRLAVYLEMRWRQRRHGPLPRSPREIASGAPVFAFPQRSATDTSPAEAITRA